MLGLSLGGALALELYRRHPRIPRTLVLASAYAGWAGSLPAELVDEVVGVMSEFHPAGYRAMAHALAEADLRDVLPRIDVPTLLLSGDADRRSPLSVAEELHVGIPASTLVVLPGVGHLANLEAPDGFNAEVRSFLRRAQA